jgi:CRISPR-associated protein Cas1
MVNKNQIKPADFTAVKGGVYLNKEGNLKFVKEYEKRTKQTVFDKDLNRKISYKNLIRHEAYKLLGHIKGTKEYKAFEMRR